MLELYLLSRIGVLYCIASCSAAISVFAAIVFFCISITSDDWTGEDIYNEWQKCKLRKFSIKMLWVFCFSIILVLLTPTTNQAYLIYGVGGTIDYIKSNDQAKQIPDKCITALNKWVDDLIDENDKSNNE